MQVGQVQPAVGAVSASHELAQAEDMLRYDARAALARAREALETASSDDATYQRWLLVKGASQSRLGDTEDGARVLREVKVWAEEHDDARLLALTHRRLSALFRRVGDPALMLEHAVLAIDLLDDETVPESGHDTPWDARWDADWNADVVRADHLLGLADALGACGSFDDAIGRYREAARLAEGCDDRYLQLAVLNNLAYTLYEADRGDEAVAAAELLLAQAAAMHQRLETHDADTIARAYTAVGRYADAAAVIEPFTRAEDTGEDCDALVMALLTTTLVRRLAGEYDAAQASLDRAGRLAARYLLSGPAIAVLGEQAELHAARGEYQLAFETHRDFHRADVELRALERDSRARSMNAIFEATEARRSSDYFRELSGRDPLTGLHNRRHLDDRLDDWLRQPGDAASVAPVDVGAPHVTPTQLTVALLDLDHFKRVNDTVSHAVGDEVLRHVATLLRTAVDDVEGGFAVRMGGEEFLLLLPGVTRAEAVARLERVRADIAGYRWRDLTPGHDLHEPLVVTASVGIAVAPDDQTERGPLLAHADANLYRAKHAGRNRVVH